MSVASRIDSTAQREARTRAPRPRSPRPARRARAAGRPDRRTARGRRRPPPPMIAVANAYPVSSETRAAAANARIVNSRGSRNGSSRRSPWTTATTVRTTGCREQRDGDDRRVRAPPAIWVVPMRVSPTSPVRSARPNQTAPGMSMRPARRGVSQPDDAAHPKRSATRPIGTLMKNTQRQAGREDVGPAGRRSGARQGVLRRGRTPRIAAPTNGPAAIPRNVSAPMTPERPRPRRHRRTGARRRPSRPGTSTPPPTAWTSRAAMSWSMRLGQPGQRGAHHEDRERAEEQPPRAPQVGEPPGQRHREDVDEQVAVDDPARLAQLDPGGAAGRVGEVVEDRRQGDGRDHELEAGEEDARAEDGEQHERRSAVHGRECTGEAASQGSMGCRWC